MQTAYCVQTNLSNFTLHLISQRIRCKRFRMPIRKIYDISKPKQDWFFVIQTFSLASLALLLSSWPPPTLPWTNSVVPAWVSLLLCHTIQIVRQPCENGTPPASRYVFAFFRLLLTYGIYTVTNLSSFSRNCYLTTITRWLVSISFIARWYFQSVILAMYIVTLNIVNAERLEKLMINLRTPRVRNPSKTRVHYKA